MSREKEIERISQLIQESDEYLDTPVDEQHAIAMCRLIEQCRKLAEHLVDNKENPVRTKDGFEIDKEVVTDFLLEEGLTTKIRNTVRQYAKALMGQQELIKPIDYKEESNG